MNNNATSKSAALITFLLLVLIAIPPSLSDTPITNDFADDIAPSAMQASDGKIWVVWHSYRTGGADIFYNTYDGFSWTGDMPLVTDQGLDGLPSITQTGDGTIWVVWTTSRTLNYDLFYKTSIDGGSTWSDATPFTTDPNDDRGSSIIQTIDDRIWVIWQSYRSGNFDLFYKTSIDGGSTWSDATQLTTDPNYDMQPSIYQISNGTILVVWTSNRTGNDDLFFKTSTNNGLSWSIDTQLTNDPESDNFATIMQTNDNNIWVVWQSDRNLQDDILYKIYDGTSWSSENYLTWFMDYDRMPSIFQATNGTVWLVWATDKTDNFDIYYKFVAADMVIRSVILSQTIVSPGDTIDITVEIGNQGTAAVTYEVATYYDGTLIGTQTGTMIPGLLSQQRIFSWDTTGVPYGYYAVSASVSTALNEKNPADNSLSKDVVVTIPGDVNGDGIVNIFDAGVISSHWYPGPPTGPLGYDINADPNSDGSIDMLDVALVNINWLHSW